MKLLPFTITLVLILAIQIFPQWYQQNSGTSSNLLFVQFVNNSDGYAVGTESQGVYFLFKTTNGGTDWFEQDTLLPSSTGFVTNFYFLNNSIGWFAAYKFNETSNIYKTSNGGENWALQFSTSPYEVVNDIQFTDPSTGYAAGLAQLGVGIIYKSTDGGYNWITLSGIGPAMMTSSLSFLNSDTGWVAGSNILKTTDGGSTWQEQLNIEPNYFISIQFVNAYTGWASTNSSIYKTTDGGNIWFQQSVIEITNTFFVDIFNGWLINGTDIYHTVDGGDNWSLQNSNSVEDLYGLFFVNQSLGWIVGLNGTILHTINGGTPVELISFVSETDGNVVILNWQTATETNNKGFKVERSQKSNPPAGEAGVQSQKWKNVGFVEGNGTSSETHQYSYIDKNVNPGKYLYRLKQIDFDGSFEYSKEIEVVVKGPAKFSLEQNYPNPFNPVTTISYELSVKSLVILKVYNTLGEEIASLVNEKKPAGRYEVRLDGSRLPSGVYIYRLQAGGFLQIKKMLLIK